MDEIERRLSDALASEADLVTPAVDAWSRRHTPAGSRRTLVPWLAAAAAVVVIAGGMTMAVNSGHSNGPDAGPTVAARPGTVESSKTSTAGTATSSSPLAAKSTKLSSAPSGAAPDLATLHPPADCADAAAVDVVNELPVVVGAFPQYITPDSKLLCIYHEGKWFTTPSQSGSVRFHGTIKTSSGLVTYGAVAGAQVTMRWDQGSHHGATHEIYDSPVYAGSHLTFFLTTPSSTLTVWNSDGAVILQTAARPPVSPYGPLADLDPPAKCTDAILVFADVPLVVGNQAELVEYLSADGKTLCAYFEGAWSTAPVRVGLLRFLGTVKTSSGSVLFGAVAGSNERLAWSNSTGMNAISSLASASGFGQTFFMTSTAAGTLVATDAAGKTILETRIGAGSTSTATTRATAGR